MIFPCVGVNPQLFPFYIHIIYVLILTVYSLHFILFFTCIIIPYYNIFFRQSSRTQAQRFHLRTGGCWAANKRWTNECYNLSYICVNCSFIYILIAHSYTAYLWVSNICELLPLKFSFESLLWRCLLQMILYRGAWKCIQWNTLLVLEKHLLKWEL